MYLTKELINSALKKLNIKPSKIGHRLMGETKYEKIIQLYQKSYTEDDIAVLLYPKGANQNFRKLKSRLIEKSADLILANFDKVKLRNRYDKDLFTVQKLLLVSNILIIKDNRTIAESLLKKSFRLALSIQLTSYVIEVARILSYTYAYKGNSKLFEYYSTIADKYLELYSVELTIETNYNALISELSNTAEYSEKQKEELKSLYADIRSISKKYRSHKLQLLYYRTGIRYFHSNHDFSNMIVQSKAAVYYMNDNPHLMQNARAGEFSLYEMDGCLRLKAYSQGEECAQRCSKYFVPYTSTWSVFNEYYFLLAMRTLNFQQAKKIYSKINGSRYKLNKMLTRQRDKWKIYEAYLNFALNVKGTAKQFNLFRYLNEIEVLKKDKQGFNYMVIISQFLLLLNLKNQDKLGEMEVSFRLYFRRNIKFKVHPRHHIMGTFILLLFKVNFDLTKINVEPFIKKLNAIYSLEETEIIPYEKLIKIILLKCTF